MSVRIRKDDVEETDTQGKKKSIVDSPNGSDNISMKSGLSAFTHKKVMKQQKKLEQKNQQVKDDVQN